MDYYKYIVGFIFIHQNISYMTKYTDKMYSYKEMSTFSLSYFHIHIILHITYILLYLLFIKNKSS